MNRTYLLGYSEAVLSMVLESLQATGAGEEIVIVQNMDLPRELPFLPTGLMVRIISSADWKGPSDGDELLFGVASPKVKKAVFNSFVNSHGIMKEQFRTLVHPSATVASSAILEPGVYIEPGSIISPFAHLEFGVTINRSVSVGHHTTIKAFSMINPGCHIAGNCIIGQEVQLGIGTVVFNEKTIGDTSIVGGGSVVTSNIEANVVAWGNPCKVVKPVSA